jgi:hypothetical protein
MLFVAVVCLSLLALPAFAQVTMQFPVARDVSILGYENHDGYGFPPEYDKTLETEEWSNHGFRPQLRGRKWGQHAVLMDWDTDAINDWIASNTNPGDTLSWTLNVYPVNGPPMDIEILSLESLNDWVEGDGGYLDHGFGGSYSNFNWSDGVAATTNFAQTAFKLDADGDRVLDLDNSLPWVDNDLGTGGVDDNQYSLLARGDHFAQGSPISDFMNSEVLYQTDLDDASFDFTYATVPLDVDLVDAILNDPDNRGIFFGPMSPSVSNNWQIYSRESSGFPDELADEIPGPVASFLEVTVTPGEGQLQAGDADMDFDFDQLDLVKVQVAAKYLTGAAATWGEGDWDGAPGGAPGSPPTGNGQFDQLDIIAALAPGHYLTGKYWPALQPANDGGVAAVPEPSGLLLAALGFAALVAVGRRRRRR